MVNGSPISSIYDIDAYNINLEDLHEQKAIFKYRSGIDAFLPEGEYVRYHKTKDGLSYFEIVTAQVMQRLDDYYIERERDENKIAYFVPTHKEQKYKYLYRATNVKSFHVNVGHGNCSFIVFKLDDHNELWAVDCSVKEYSENYVLNVYQCLADIKRRYGVNKISVLMVTHLHYDHINGIDLLIDNGYVDSNTDVWMNIDYPCKMATYKRIERRLLDDIGCSIVIPTSGASMIPNIRILYPDINFDSGNMPPNNHINNSSVLYLIDLGRTMLFTGDIETSAWKIIDDTRIPRDFNERIDYYCISHHGSKTGMPHLQELIDAFNMCRKQILMGRDGAYPGIFSKDVKKAFKNIIITTPKCSYLELDWDSGNCSKH